MARARRNLSHAAVRCYGPLRSLAIELILFGAVVLVTAWIAHGIFAHLRRSQRAAAALESRTHAALESPGGLPSHPIEVTSAAAVDPRAESEPCRVCGGRLHVEAHDALQLGGTSLRRVRLHCGSCGRASELFFRLRSAPN
jgi:hypothetical protein